MIRYLGNKILEDIGRRKSTLAVDRHLTGHRDLGPFSSGFLNSQVIYCLGTFYMRVLQF